jgi:hypothetical protein
MAKLILIILVKAETEEDYDRYYHELSHATGGEDSLFMDYFDRNWVTCVERWCSLYRDDHYHVRNDTNNRLEGYWRVLKAICPSSNSMEFAISAFLIQVTRLACALMCAIQKHYSNTPLPTVRLSCLSNLLRVLPLHVRGHG